MIDNGPIVKANNVDSVAVAGEVVAYSKAFDLVDVDEFALEYQAACTGNPNIKMELQQCSDEANWYLPDTMSEVVSSLTNKSPHGVQLSPITVRYMRIKITGLTGNPSDTVISLKLSLQKRFAA